VYDILTCGEGKVIHSDGLVWYKRESLPARTTDHSAFGAGLLHETALIPARSTVTFRLVVFSPFQGEVLLGQVLSNTPEYIRGERVLLVLVLVPSSFLISNHHRLTAPVPPPLIFSVSVGFFTDVYIPAKALPPSSA
jgi:hypothetical protein